METPQEKIETIDQYIQGFPKDIQSIMLQVRHTIRTAAPEAKETISWGMPTFRMKKILVHFAGHNHHLGFYPWPETIEVFKERLTGYKTSKGAIQFPYNQPIPLGLITDMVLYRLERLNDK